MPSFGMWHRALEECIASIIRVKRISELGTTLAVTGNCIALHNASVASYCQHYYYLGDSLHPDE
jgi:hypothetical protein